MLRGQNKCPEAFGGDPSLTHSFNLRSEYSGNISLRVGEAGLQTGASSGSTSEGETKIACSSSNCNRDNPSAAGRGSFDSCGISENRDFGGGGTSLGGGGRAGRDGIDIGFRIDSIKDRDNKGGNQGGGSSTWAAGHHSSGHHTHSQGSDTSPSQSAGGKKSNSKDASGSGSSDNKNGSKQGAASNNAGGTAGQSKGDGGGNPSSGDGSGQNNNSQNGPAGGGDGNENGGVDSPPSSESSPQIIPNTTPNPTAQAQPAATSTSGASNEGTFPNVTPILTTSPESSPSTTDGHDIMVGIIGVSVESPSSLQSASTSTVANSHISPTGRNSTASPPGRNLPSTTTTATVSPSVARNTISTSTNSRGLVGGIIGGIIAFSALLALLIFLLVRKRRRLRITSSLFNFDTEKFVGAKRSAEPVDDARVSTSATHLVSPLVVKREPPPEWGDDRCHDDHDEAFRPTQASRDNVAKPSQDAAHARTSIIFDPFADPVPVVEDLSHNPAREPRHACRDSGTSSLAMSYEEGTVQEASRVPVRRLGSSVLSFDHDTFAKLR